MHDIQCSDGLAPSVFRIISRFSNDVLKPYFQDSMRLFINFTIDPFNSAASSESTDVGFGDAINVVP